MTNRTEEYWALIGELAQPPQRLAGSVERARRRARRTRLAQTLMKPLGTLAAAAACFVLLVNAVPTFALACGGIPLIRELTAAVALSPSLSAAVAHDYVQYIGQSRTVDGVTVRLEHAIVDRNQAVFFYQAEGGRFYTSPNLTGPDGEGIGGYSCDNSAGGDSGLDAVTLSFAGGECALPDRFTMEMFFLAEEEPLPDQMEAVAPERAGNAPADEWGDPREDPGVVRLTFEVALDPARIAEPVVVPVGRWMELDGQRIQVDRLECTPTRTVLYLREDEGNRAWLTALKFRFEDKTGRSYDNLDGSLSASGESSGSRSFLTYYFQSFYYGLPEGLTLCVDKAEWLDKDAPHVFLDLDTGLCPGLPEGVRVDRVDRAGDTAAVKLISPLERQGFAQTFGHSYWDPEGGEHSFNQWGGGTEYGEDDSEIGTYEMIFLQDYPWDRVELELAYTSMTEYPQPVRVPLLEG